MKTRNIVMFAEGGMPKTKLAMLKWLNSHDKYQDEYEIGIRIRDLNRKTKEEESALWHCLSDPFVNERFFEELDKFAESHAGYDIRVQGRSNGHAVLCTLGKELLVEDELDINSTYADIRERVKLVRDFDRAVNAAVLVFLEFAVDQYQQGRKLEVALSGAKRKTCEYVSASALIPEDMREYFWEVISEDAPFSWGDNEVSLVTASRLAVHAQQRLDDSKESDDLVQRLNDLGDIYIDLES